MRVSDYIAQHIESIGVKAIFMLSGGGMMHLLDSASQLKKTSCIYNHHEQCSGIAADAYARVSHHIGCCYVTSGPGGTNAVTAVAGAFQDSSPVLFISGQSKLSQTIEGSGIKDLRQFGTFEVDIIPIVKPITKYAVMLKKATDIKYVLEKAIFLATHDRPGPVFIDIPLDLQGAPIEVDQLKGFSPADEGYVKFVEPISDIKIVIEQLKKAKRPLFLVGYGVSASSSNAQFLKITEQLKTPVVTTCFGKDLMPFEHELFVGHPGVKGDRAGNFSIQTADLIISIGASLHVTTTGYELDQFAPQAFKILIDPDAAVLNRESVGVNLKIKSDIPEFLRQFLIELSDVELNFSSHWLAKCQSWKKKYSVYNEPHKREYNQINFYDFSKALDSLASENDIIVTDAGSAFYVIGQAFRVKKGQRVINSGSLGAMGFALPAATGAALANTKGSVLCVTGDGSLQTNLHELAVISHHQLNIKIFIINNDGYVCIRNTQNNFFNGRLAGTSTDSGVFIPKLENLCTAFNLKYKCVNQLDQLNIVVDEVLKANGPIVCEVFTPNYQEIIPTVSSVRLESGQMKSKPIHDMFPFLPEEVIQKEMTIDL